MDNMKLCLIGKYPPIEGGVARDMFWASFALAQHGFTVHVVTNAREVEAEFRVFDASWDAGLLPDPRELVGGRLAVHYTTSADQPAYIPWANPFVTKLAALATEVVEEQGCELIHGHYFEPYGMAAQLAAYWTGVPFGVRHAGSDVGRLMLDAALGTAYRRLLLTADYVFAAPSTIRRFLRLGVPFERLYRFPALSPPEQYFNPRACPLDVNRLRSAIVDGLPPDFYDGGYHRLGERLFDPTRPTIGIYGKLGQAKGTFDLVRALGQLKRAGLEFNFLALTQGYAQRVRAFLQCVADNCLEADTWLLPFLPHWYVPNFIRACTAVCFLERGFPIGIHLPAVPHEVFACGTALVLSREIAANGQYAKALADGENVFLAEPRDPEQLAMVLRGCITDPARSRAVGRNGHRDFAPAADGLTAFGVQLVSLYDRIREDVQADRQARRIAEFGRALVGLGGRDGAWQPVGRTAPAEAARKEEVSTRTLGSETSLPALCHDIVVTRRARVLRCAYRLVGRLEAAALARYAEGYAREQMPETVASMLDSVLDFGGFLQRILPADAAFPPYAAELACYERLWLRAAYEPGADDVLETINRRPAQRPSAVTRNSRPMLRPGLQIASFRYDVAAIADALASDEPAREWTEQSCCLIIQQAPNSVSPQLIRIQPFARLVLALCDGHHPAGRIAAQLGALGTQRGLEPLVLRLIADLATAGVVSI
jgi:glycosyltransferase involved in cell wall biosynthesis